MSGVLLLIAVQGVKVQRISAGDSAIELAEIRKGVAEQAEASATENPDEAEELLDSYEAADPQARADPSISAAKASIYERQAVGAVRRAMEAIDPEFHLTDDTTPVIRTRGRALLIETKYRLPHRKLYLNDARQVAALITATSADGALLISNVRPTTE